ncbi:MAG TPA: VOC family protein [Chloroflexota bacterium]|nr:VOC family protein [Chloroflexota bacterium]
MNIHSDTKIGAVYLTVSDFGRSLPYYQHNIGLQLHRQEGRMAYLGAGGRDLLVLHELPAATHPRRTTGLYHFAILVPSRLELARTLKNLIDTETHIDGASDHLVSEALYLSDPDGNGIEIYRDRHRHEWPVLNGQIQMDTKQFDVESVLSELHGRDLTRDYTWGGLHADTTIGHIHLHVSHLAEAEAFYTQVLGFDLIMRYGPSAAFVSAGGYHHHIGLNTWAGVGAPPPPPGSVGLDWYEILLPDEEALAATAVRLQNAHIPTEQSENGLFLRDPAQNGIVLRIR